ncbi:hypothetical protein AB6A40_001710 [Gnathostoma spinigerum]|uniref:Palmitoyltransferase n=1 Tax=Gnathostoma spinigerum TaxID=75299 RepID=A0ABD6E762_9BILA
MEEEKKVLRRKNIDSQIVLPSTSNGCVTCESSYQENSDGGTSSIIEAPDWEIIAESTDYEYEEKYRRRLLHFGPVLAMALTFVIGSCATYLHLLWWPITSPSGFLHLSLFLFFNYCVYVNLTRSAIIGPGYVPFGWRPVNKKDEVRLQYCRTCKSFKAPRSHHCTRCGRCVMKMDHHCPWINNCVGHRNHAFFVRFLVSAVIGSFHASIIIAFSVYHAFFRTYYLLHRTENESLIVLDIYSLLIALIVFGLSLGVIVAVGVLMGLQLWGIFKNQTGIEEYIVEKANSYHLGGTDFIYPYDLGWKRNFCEVLGSWSGIPKGNGIWWPVKASATQFSLSEEQLFQKKVKWERAQRVEITEDFPSDFPRLLSFFIERPCTFLRQAWGADGKRVYVKKGQLWNVTSSSKYWLYGTRIFNEEKVGEQQEPVSAEIERGWFPRACAEDSDFI